MIAAILALAISGQNAAVVTHQTGKSTSPSFDSISFTAVPVTAAPVANESTAATVEQKPRRLSWPRLDLFKRKKSQQDGSRWRLPFARRHKRPPSDWTLSNRCRTLLSTEPELAAATVHVSAKDGVVLLQGTVSSENARQKAGDLARRAEGVVHVDNQLRVKNAAHQWYDDNPVTLQAPVLSSTSVPTPSPVTPYGQASSGPTDWTPSTPVSPEQIVRVSPDLPAVSTYYVRLGRPEAVAVSKPVRFEDESRAWRPVVRSFDVVTKPINVAARVETPIKPTQAVTPEPALADKPDPGKPSDPRAPATLNRSDGLRADINAILAESPRTGGLTYSLQSGQLLLSGTVPQWADLYRVASRLGDLPGVDYVSWDHSLTLSR